MRLTIAVWLGLVLYALLSVVDWMMTFALLRSNSGAVEANPLAAACLEQYGWNGLALYKAGGVLMFAGAIFLLVRRRPAVAAGVVALGCAVLLSVAVYTHNLICQTHREDAELAGTEYPQRKPAPKPNGLAIPSVCWFAQESAGATASQYESQHVTRVASR